MVLQLSEHTGGVETAGHFPTEVGINLIIFAATII